MAMNSNSTTTQDEGLSRGQPAAAELERRFTVADIFRGSEGLRAGWGIALFIAMCLLLRTGAGMLLAALLPAGSRNSVVFGLGDALVSETAALFCYGLATVLMAVIEGRPV